MSAKTSGEIAVKAAMGDYAVHVGPGQLARLGDRMRALPLEGRVALITDENVAAAWGWQARGSLERAGYPVELFTVPPGEATKTLEHAERLWGGLIERGFSRKDLVVALGGGVVGDLAGFVAATFHRGMALVQVPSSLLAQVDSSVGGKVAIDHRLGKNLIGAFHAARLVVADTSVLATLPTRERWSGLAEVAKAGLIGDLKLLELLERHLEEVGEGTASPEVVAEAIERAIRVKAQVVSIDEREQGPRMWLNFGHTIGHGVEAAAGYGPLTHGEAVVVGMRSALVVSERLGRLTRQEAERAQALLARFPAPPALEVPELASVLELIARDKKARAGRVRFVVLDGLGAAAIEPGLAPELLEEVTRLALGDLRENTR